MSNARDTVAVRKATVLYRKFVRVVAMDDEDVVTVDDDDEIFWSDQDATSFAIIVDERAPGWLWRLLNGRVVKVFPGALGYAETEVEAVRTIKSNVRCMIMLALVRRNGYQLELDF